MQSAQTATLVARIPIVLFVMTHSPRRNCEKVVASNARKFTQLYLTILSAMSF
jgi:hypothetical protein